MCTLQLAISDVGLLPIIVYLDVLVPLLPSLASPYPSLRPLLVLPMEPSSLLLVRKLVVLSWLR